MKDSISSYTSIRDSIALADSLRQKSVEIRPVLGEVVQANDSAAYNLYTEKPMSEDRIAHDGTPLHFSIEQTDGVFALLLLCFLFFAHLYNGGFTFLKENLSLLFHSEKGQRAFKQTTVKEYLYTYFLVFQTVVLIAICVYDIFIEYDPQSNAAHRPFISILLNILLIGLFLGVKDVLYIIIGYIFDGQRQMNVWRRTHLLGIEVLGILYFIPTLLLVYSDFYHTQIVIFMLILFLIVQLILFYQIIIFFIREKFNFLYLIAYLCTVEILPYIFLIIGLVYLYRIDVLNILWH
ncbi:DUF4271 domain-containing protein [Prevotella sp. 10(H)]|uniref:DUF4271 domain-containing protein n=1 Tax=Prevotella sp. 10(H) TaxID=1158294 RepID=UPI000B0B579C|nr:DUF4271 domain-containing protein [Prevotella sp. 10(H)]